LQLFALLRVSSDRPKMAAIFAFCEDAMRGNRLQRITDPQCVAKPSPTCNALKCKVLLCIACNVCNACNDATKFSGKPLLLHGTFLLLLQAALGGDPAPRDLARLLLIARPGIVLEQITHHIGIHDHCHQSKFPWRRQRCSQDTNASTFAA
jgi:hypothetical protein